jgi:hypothetical protein
MVVEKKILKLENFRIFFFLEIEKGIGSDSEEKLEIITGRGWVCLFGSKERKGKLVFEGVFLGEKKCKYLRVNRGFISPLYF